MSEIQTSILSSLGADRPIEDPAEDVFGFAPFARAIATSIAGLTSPEGFVIGLHGSWGAGKSSAVNLIKFYLKQQVAVDLTTVDFNPWWFNGQEALASAFFSELGPAIGKSLPEKTRNVFRSLGRRLSTAGSAAGGAAGGTAVAIGDALGADQTVPEEHVALTKALRRLNRRILVVVDDLDRLAPEDALLVFKLVKSVGRLPNLIYLLVFDRELAEKAVSERFPSEGPHFLEKIVQASFELPPALVEDLWDLLLTNVERIMGAPEQGRVTRFMNLFYDVVAPEITLPRDVIRLTNALEVSWSAVAGEVDRADFLAMETLRLFKPRVHRAVYDNKDLVCGTDVTRFSQSDSAAKSDQRLLTGVSDADRERVRNALMRLFPALEGVWSNRYYAGGFGDSWRQERRVCVDIHFDTYFRFSISDSTTSAVDFQSFMAAATNPANVREKFLEAVKTLRRRGGTKAAVLLEELTAFSSRIPEDLIEPLVIGIFQVADEIDVPADRAGAFSIGDNPIRIHWLLNRLVVDRLDPSKRDALIEKALSTASLAWAIDVTSRCLRAHTPTDDGSPPDRPPLVSPVVAERLRLLILERLKNAAADGTLWKLDHPVHALFRWRDLMGTGGIEHLRAWLDSQLKDDFVVVRLADSLISHSWSASLDDHVAHRSEHVNADSVQKLVDPKYFLRRIDSLLDRADTTVEDRAALKRFKTAWEKREDEDL